jgi:hypothetical protein
LVERAAVIFMVPQGRWLESGRVDFLLSISEFFKFLSSE